MAHVCQPTGLCLHVPHLVCALKANWQASYSPYQDCRCELARPLPLSSGAVATLVVCEAVHMCMVARGVEKHASSTVTCAARGACKANGELRTDLLKILNSASFC